MKGFAIPLIGVIAAIALLGGSVFFFGVAVKSVTFAIASFLLVIIGVVVSMLAAYLMFIAKKQSRNGLIMLILGVALIFIGAAVSMLG